MILRRDEHFNKYLNTEVEVSLFKPLNGEKKIRGILTEFNENNLKIDDFNIDRKDISVVRTVYNF